MRELKYGLLALAIVLTIALLAGVAQAQTALDVGAVGIRTFSGETLGGVCLALHVIPPGDKPIQKWASQHITLDILQIGSALDVTKASLGTSLNLLAPEGSVKLGISYLWQEKTGAVYLGFSVPIK